jgi:hypothetical protein
MCWQHTHTSHPGTAHNSALTVCLQVLLDIWHPTNLALTAADATLNSVLPINAAPSAPACASYQFTALRLTATFSNSGTAPSDTIAVADVTSWATFASNDTNVAQVFGAMVKVSVNMTLPAAQLRVHWHSSTGSNRHDARHC